MEINGENMHMDNMPSRHSSIPLLGVTMKFVFVYTSFMITLFILLTCLFDQAMIILLGLGGLTQEKVKCWQLHMLWQFCNNCCYYYFSLLSEYISQLA